MAEAENKCIERCTIKSIPGRDTRLIFKKSHDQALDILFLVPCVSRKALWVKSCPLFDSAELSPCWLCL